MKRAMAILVLGVILGLASGCAVVGPYAVGRSGWQVSVASLTAERARYDSQTLDEGQYQRRAQARQANCLAEIWANHSKPTSASTALSTLAGYGAPAGSEGYLGGFQVILINDSRYNVAFQVSDRRGQQWLFKLQPTQTHIFRLEVGSHYVMVFRENYSRPWVETTMRVWQDPCFHYNGQSYHGFCRVWGRGGSL